MMSYEEKINKIANATNKTVDEIKAMVAEKAKLLSGFVSKDGAAHIIANELGVKLYDEIKTTGKVKVNEVNKYMRDLEIVGKVISKFDIREFTSNNRKGKVGSMIIADETGRIRVVLWGSKADELNNLLLNDIVQINGAYVKESNNFLEIHLGDRAKLIKNPPGENIDVDIKQETLRRNISKIDDKIDEAEVLGYVVQAFDIKYFEICPECGKRLKIIDNALRCPIHGEVTPDYGYLINLLLDDGSGSIRVTFFRYSLEKLINKTKEEILSYKDDITAMEALKRDLLGKRVLIKGRINNNEMFGRLEMIANSVMEPSAEAELKRLDALQ